MLHLGILVLFSSISWIEGKLLQSSITISAKAIYRFQPANEIELLESLFMPSLMRCSALCIRLTDCRTFDYEPLTNRCRLFQGSFDTGEISNGSSKIGSLPLEPRFFIDLYNASCEACMNNRYLICNEEERCRCPRNTFWNGLICQNQLYEGATCNQDQWCRTDLGLICSASGRICSSSSFQTCPVTNTLTNLFIINRNTTFCINSTCTQSLTIGTSYFTLYCMSMIITIRKTSNLLGIISFNHTFPSFMTNITMWSNNSHYLFGIQTTTSGFIFALSTYNLAIKLNVTNSRLSSNDTYEMIGLNGLNGTQVTSGHFL